MKTAREMISKDDLFAKLSPKPSSAIFTKALDELLDVEVAMLDDGEETDAYFIHL